MRFTYMFKFGIDIPEGAASLILPKNEKVVLFAATLVGGNSETYSGCHYLVPYSHPQQ